MTSPLPPLQLSVLHAIESHARHRPHKLALSDPTGDVDYRTLWDRTLRIAGHLRGEGMADGDVVALATAPSTNFVVTALGIMAGGGVVAPVNTRLAPGEVSRYLASLQAARVVTDEGHTGFAPDGLTAHLFGADPTSAPWNDAAPLTDWERHVRPEAAAMIFPTGGTTGIPKGAVHLHHGIHAYCSMQGLNGFKLTSDIELSVSPMFHVAFLSGPMTVLFLGATCLVRPTFEPDVVAEILSTQPVTMVFGTPVHFQSILGSPRFAGSQHLRLLNSGGSNATTELLRELLRAFPNAQLTSTYGATELGLITMAMHSELIAGRIDGVGRPSPGVDIRVMDANGAEVGDGVAGELLIRTPWQAAGYWRNSEETATTWRGTHVAIGDIGSFDDGWLTLRGRKKEMILSGGENVFPNEVENVLAGHPEIAEVAAFGCPDPHWGERVEAAVVLTAGHDDIDPDAVWKYCSADLARYKFPKALHVVSALPKTPVGKIDRRALRQQFGEQAQVESTGAGAMP